MKTNSNLAALIQVGTRVYCGLYGGKFGTICGIHGEQSPDSIKTLGGGMMVTGGRATFDTVWDNGSYSNGTPEAIIRGVQWEIYYDEIRTASEIMAAKAHAKTVLEEKDNEAERSAIRREQDKETMRLSKPHLKQVEKYSGGKQCAVNIRIELKRAFKGVKFSVRSDYSSVNISWTDGPTAEQVEAIANRYEEGSFNGMEDIYEYDSSAFNDVFGGVKYVFTRRDNSDKAIAEAIDFIFEDLKYNLEGIDKPAVEDYTNGKLYNVEIPGLCQPLSRYIGEELSKTPCA